MKRKNKNIFPLQLAPEKKDAFFPYAHARDLLLSTEHPAVFLSLIPSRSAPNDAQ